MRQSRQVTARTRERIGEVASERIRQQAPGRPAVAEIMRADGPTHGGSYKHLESRVDLIAEATEKALADSDRHVHEFTDRAQDPLAALVDRYVSAAHRYDPGTGCAVAALGDHIRRGFVGLRSA